MSSTTQSSPRSAIQQDSEEHSFSGKGLAAGKVGVPGAVVIGVACIAPAYTLTSGLGPTIAAVGTHVPAILLLGFIPMLLVAFGYKELNNRVPDSGTSFTWASKAFNPWIGWMGGWGLIASTVIVLSNLAAVAVDFFYLMLGQIFSNPEIAAWTNNLWINIPTTIILTFLAAWISYVGVEATKMVQYVLVFIQVAVLGGFAIMAFKGMSDGTAHDATPISLDWFNPLSVGDFSVVAAGLSLSIFMFWGWDTTLTMNEETKNPKTTSARASIIVMLVIMTIYIVVAMAVTGWAGTGDTGLGAGNPENQESIFAALAGPVMGPLALAMAIGIMASSFASLQSTMVSPSRTLLAMGYYGALPKSFSKVSPKYRTPSFATISSAIAACVFYVVTRLLSESALWDTIEALGLMICFYYGVTALAAVWYMRKELFVSVRAFFARLLFPLLGGVMLLVMFVKTAIDSIDPHAEGSSGSSLFGVGMVFILGVGVLAIGVVLMIIQSIRHPEFFRGQTLKKAESTTDTHHDDVLDDPMESEASALEMPEVEEEA